MVMIVYETSLKSKKKGVCEEEDQYTGNDRVWKEIEKRMKNKFVQKKIRLTVIIRIG